MVRTTSRSSCMALASLTKYATSEVRQRILAQRYVTELPKRRTEVPTSLSLAKGLFGALLTVNRGAARARIGSGWRLVGAPVRPREQQSLQLRRKRFADSPPCTRLPPVPVRGHGEERDERGAVTIPGGDRMTERLAVKTDALHLGQGAVRDKDRPVLGLRRTTIERPGPWSRRPEDEPEPSGHGVLSRCGETGVE